MKETKVNKETEERVRGRFEEFKHSIISGDFNDLNGRERRVCLESFINSFLYKTISHTLKNEIYHFLISLNCVEKCQLEVIDLDDDCRKFDSLRKPEDAESINYADKYERKVLNLDGDYLDVDYPRFGPWCNPEYNQSIDYGIIIVSVSLEFNEIWER